MSNYQTVLSLIEELEIKCWTTQVYIKITGGLDLGVFLERIVWWSDKTSRTDGYFWKKAEEWGEELCVSYDQIKRMEKNLKKLGFIETALKRANKAPTTHYKPVMPVILNSIKSILEKVENQESLKSDFQESPKSLTGKTQEEHNSSSGSKNGKDPSAKQLENWAMFDALLKVCKIDSGLATDKIKGQFNQAGKIMRDNGHSVEDVLNFETWWYENDWRGQRSPPQAPTLQNVRDEWGKFKASANKPKVILK